MQIHLKQPEITDALQQYIAAQGINLHNKHFFTSFTSGRKGSGLSVEISIIDKPSEPYGLTPYAHGQVEVAMPSGEAAVFNTVAIEEIQEEPVYPTDETSTQPPVKTTSLFA